MPTSQGASAPIGRDAAAQLNPIISSLWTEDTLANAEFVVRDLGYLLSQVEAQETSGNDPRFGRLWMFCEVIAAALRWESENLRSVEAVRKERNHG